MLRASGCVAPLLYYFSLLITLIYNVLIMIIYHIEYYYMILFFPSSQSLPVSSQGKNITFVVQPKVFKYEKVITMAFRGILV